MAMKGVCGLTLEGLYETIQELQRTAQLSGHRKFLAARVIEKTYRGYRVRIALRLCITNVIRIQKCYRGYKARQAFYDLLERRVQSQLMDHYNRRATIIQKVYRGYRSRKYIHDFGLLRQQQRQAAKDLILCVAHKLHHLLRTRQIPGVYSLRNTHCLSKVEELLASLKFKEYNEEVRKRRSEQKRKIYSVAQRRKDGTVKIPIPFGPQCQRVYKTFSIDRMDNVLDKFKVKPRYVPPKSVQIAGIQKPDDGLYDKVVISLQKCNIVKLGDELSVCPNILQRPERIEQFCSEMTNICRTQGL